VNTEHDLDEAGTEQLQAKVDEIKSILDEARATGWHLNEADTERIIIDPLLHTLGYGPLDIRKRGHDSVANNFPDYTLLPNQAQKWFLEVKKLDLSLQDGEAAQAVNYANNQGAEWAVLTNGRKWYIYNAHLPKPLTEKRVFQIDDLFDEAETLKTLAFLSRTSMLASGLTHAWMFEQIQSIVKTQIETPNSAVRKRLRQVVVDEIKAPVPDDLLEKAIHILYRIPHSLAANSLTQRKFSQKSMNPPPDRTIIWYGYSDLTGYPTDATGKKPCLLRFMDGTTIPVTSWREAAREITKRICGDYGLPHLPFNGGIQGKRYFINSTPTHVNGEEMESDIILIAEQTVYMHTNRSTQNFAKCLVSLFKAVGAPSDIVKVSVR
jgi:hypothetical protein